MKEYHERTREKNKLLIEKAALRRKLRDEEDRKGAGKQASTQMTPTKAIPMKRNS